MLVGNRSVLHKSPGRFLNGGVGIYRSAFAKPGMLRGAGFSALSGIPNGHLAPSAWLLPAQAGAMSSIGETEATVAASGLAVGGITTTGTSSVTIQFSDAYGQLIASGDGSATVAMSFNAALLTASIGGTGEAAITLATNTPILGALADGQGEATLTVTATNSEVKPSGPLPGLPVGSATMTLTGTLTPYAIGSMTGTTEEAGLSNAGIANSVWGKVIEAGYSAEQVLRLLGAFAAGSATGLEGSNPQFTGLDGVTLRIDGSYSSGTRTIDALNGE